MGGRPHVRVSWEPETNRQCHRLPLINLDAKHLEADMEDGVLDQRKRHKKENADNQAGQRPGSLVK